MSNPDPALHPQGIPSKSRAPILAGILVFAIVLGFAAYTNHAWEDFYITYRTSVNLAEGKGMVFTPGEKVHSFTSPLNTVIPAVFRYLVGAGKTQTVLWLYRLVCAGLLALACALLTKALQSLKFGLMPLLATIVLTGLEAKVVDYTINGQEIALMVFFLTLSIIALLGTSKKPAILLTIAWTGAAYSRPDSAVYCGAIALGFLLFPQASVKQDNSARSRLELLKMFGTAAAISILLFLPWILWAWSYYGSPIPHTITAKGLGMPHGLKTVLAYHLQQIFVWDPLLSRSLQSVFMPANYHVGGWGVYLPVITCVVSCIGAFYWLFPLGNPKARALSLASFISLAYLCYIPKTAFSWYYPNAWVSTALALGFILQDIYCLAKWAGSKAEQQQTVWLKRLSCAVPAALISLTILMTLLVACQMRQQQQIIETGLRMPLGKWLKENADSPRDTVFAECLGYVGFYSGLKMLDYPGLSSPEMVDARKRLGENYADLIADLKPDWLVLRPSECAEITDRIPELLTKDYALSKVFDAANKVKGAVFIPGRNYLYGDMTFRVFHRIRHESLPEK